jgi:hypothetical protein
MPVMRDPGTPSAIVVLLAAGVLAGCSSGATRQPVVTTPVAQDYLRIVAVAPAYVAALAPGDRWVIYLSGFIDTGATARLEQLLVRRDIRRAIIYLDSPGGHLVEAMSLGRAIRARAFDTVVGSRSADAISPGPGRCYSACPFAFAGGVRRSLGPGSTLGVHRAENRVAVADEAAFQGAVASQATEYLAAMGVSVDLVALMAGVPHAAIREIPAAEASRLRLLTGPAPARPSP